MLKTPLEELRTALGDRYVIERGLGRRDGDGVRGPRPGAGGARRPLTLRWADPAAICRCKKEFRALADVAHENLVQLHGLVATEGLWFFTTELVAGCELMQYVRPGYQPEGAGAEITEVQPTGSGSGLVHGRRGGATRSERRAR